MFDMLDFQHQIRPFSKLSVSRDPALDRMMEEQRKMIHKNHQEMQMMESEFQDYRNTRSTPVKGSLTDQMNGMVIRSSSLYISHFNKLSNNDG